MSCDTDGCKEYSTAYKKIAYRMSDAITVISEDMKLKVVEQGIPEDKVYEIVNWFDDRTVREITWEEKQICSQVQPTARLLLCAIRRDNGLCV